jgi:outer membrane protein assembly factor BamB
MVDDLIFGGFDGTPCLAAVNASTGQLVWKRCGQVKPSGCCINAPAINADGTLIAFGVAYYGGELFMLDPNNGSVYWSADYSPAGGFTSGGIWDTEGCFFAHTRQAFMAFSPNHSLTWRFDGHPQQDWYAPVLALDGEAIYLIGLNPVYALDAHSGITLWQTTQSYFGGTLSLSADGQALFVGASGHLTALNASTGSIIWVLSVTSSGDPQLGAPAIGTDGTLYVGGDEFRALEPLSGNTLWIASFPSSYSPILGADGVVYVLALNRTLFALNSSDGEVLWFILLGDVRNTVYPPCLGVSGRLYVPTVMGTYAFESYQVTNNIAEGNSRTDWEDSRDLELSIANSMHQSTPDSNLPEAVRCTRILVMLTNTSHA